MIRMLVVAMLLGAVACADDDPPVDGVDAGAADAAPSDAAPPDAPAATGSASVTGTVAEHEVTPTDAFFMDHPLVSAEILVMPEAGATCSVEGQSGITAVIGFPCGPAAAGTHVVRDTQMVDCDDTPHVFVLVEGYSGEFSEYMAVDGTVTIATFTATEVTGSFSADYGDKGALEGTFDAVVCD